MGGDMDLDRIIDRWRGPLVGLLGARGASPADAVELAQDAFSEAYLGRERFEGSWEDDGAVGAWLRGIALNLLRAGARRRSGGHRLTLVGDRDALDRLLALGKQLLVEVGQFGAVDLVAAVVEDEGGFVAGSGVAEEAGFGIEHHV